MNRSTHAVGDGKLLHNSFFFLCSSNLLRGARATTATLHFNLCLAGVACVCASTPRHTSTCDALYAAACKWCTWHRHSPRQRECGRKRELHRKAFGNYMLLLRRVVIFGFGDGHYRRTCIKLLFSFVPVFNPVFRRSSPEAAQKHEKKTYF